MFDYSSFYKLLNQIKEDKITRIPFKRTNKVMVCIKNIEGFTIGKRYRLIGSGGEYIQLKDDNGEEVILFENYFK